MMQMQLGMIPSWQFSADPGVNIKLNPHVQFPPGWTQGTVQPVGPNYAAPARVAQPTLSGLGLLPRTKTLFCDQSCGCAPQNPCCCGESAFRRAARSVGFRGLGTVSTPIALMVGGFGLLAAAGLGVYAFKRRRRRR